MKKAPSHEDAFISFTYLVKGGLSSLIETGSLAGISYILLAGAAVNLNLYRFYIRVPDFIGSSMGMAYSIT